MGNKTLLTEALMSVIAQANDDQSAQSFYSYSPYGEVQALGSDEGNPLQFTGRENDGTGLYYYRARYYDPVLKQFLSEDPIGLAGGINARAFVDGDPINNSDPLGLFSAADLPSILQPALDFLTGVADAASLGLGPLAREALDVSGGVDVCSGSYTAGQYASLFLGVGRLAYAGAAKALPIFVARGSTTLESALAVSAAAGNFIACRDPWNDIDWNLAVVSGLGASAGRAIGNYLSISNRSATSYIINQRMGPTSQPVVDAASAMIRGGTSGGAQLGYRDAFYPRGYPGNGCGCP